MRMPFVLVRRAAVAGALLLAAGALWGEGLSPEDKLAAIRKGLVQAALDGPTQVSTTRTGLWH